MSSPVDDLPNPFERYAMADLSASSVSRDYAAATSSSAEHTGPTTPSADRPREKKRVGFTGSDPSSPTQLLPSYSPGGSGASTPGRSRQGSDDLANQPPLGGGSGNKSHLPELSRYDTEQLKRAFGGNIASRPRPVLRNVQPPPAAAQLDSEDDSDGHNQDKAYRRQKAREALQRGRDLERDERIRSEPSSRQVSPRRTFPRPALTLDNMPLPYTPSEHDSDADTAVGGITPREDGEDHQHSYFPPSVVAHNLIQNHKEGLSSHHEGLDPTGLRSGAVTPVDEREYFEEYAPRPSRYRGGVLGALMKLHRPERSLPPDGSLSTRLGYYTHDSTGDLFDSSALQTPTRSPSDSGASTPKGRRGSWYFGAKNHSTSSLAQLVGSSSGLASPAVAGFSEEAARRLKKHKEQHKRPGISDRVRGFNKHIRSKQVDEIRIKNHIAETIQRQRYLEKLCRALMMYGAPTHRLEEYMKMSSRVLEIEAQFLYIPGAMIMSFNDPATHTTEVILVKVGQGLDLGKLRDVHEIYKDVVHDRIGVVPAMTRLRDITSKPLKYNRWMLVPVYGLASVCVGPFAFGAQWIDLPIAFFLGCIVGFLQLFMAPKHELFANVFEVSASVITSFLARAFGSINGGNLFCFSSLAQSSIALILPGYTVLLASLELQSRSLVAGSVRMVYAIIYSLMLGYGITIGTAIYGLIDHNATSATTCQNSIPPYIFFLFVPGFTLSLIIINQGKWKQAPMMLFISFAGYVVNYFSARRFQGNTQISNTLGALAIGVLANGYSRIGSRVENFALDLWEYRLRHVWKRFRWAVFRVSFMTTPKCMEEGLAGDNESIFVPQARRVGYSLAAAAMLPAIFVQVPSGLAVSGSLVSGIASADQITGNVTNGTGTVIANVTSVASTATTLNTVAFNVGYSVIQVAIGITVGLFLSALVVYPFGKKRSGLFSF